MFHFYKHGTSFSLKKSLSDLSRSLLVCLIRMTAGNFPLIVLVFYYSPFWEKYEHLKHVARSITLDSVFMDRATWENVAHTHTHTAAGKKRKMNID